MPKKKSTKTTHAIYELSIFCSDESVELPERREIEFELKIISEKSTASDMPSITEAMSRAPALVNTESPCVTTSISHERSPRHDRSVCSLRLRRFMAIGSIFPITFSLGQLQQRQIQCVIEMESPMTRTIMHRIVIIGLTIGLAFQTSCVRPPWQTKQPRVTIIQQPATPEIQAKLLQEVLTPSSIYSVKSSTIPGIDLERGKDSRIRECAVDRLTDQELLTKVALLASEEEVGSRVIQRSVTKLTSQVTLEKVALEARSIDARDEATSFLTNQTVLEQIALNASARNSTRQIAIQNLKDEAVIARIAKEVNSEVFWDVYRSELATDHPAVLEKIAEENCRILDGFYEVRRKQAIQRVTNQAVLLRITQDEQALSFFRALAVTSLQDKPALKVLAEDTKLSANNPIRATARLKMAIQEPRIAARLPHLQAIVSIRLISEQYEKTITHSDQHSMLGEYVYAYLVDQDDSLSQLKFENPDFLDDWQSRHLTGILVRKSWRTFFPRSIPSDDPRRLIEPNMDIKEILTALMSLPVFTPEDLSEMSVSTIPEVSAAALASGSARKGS